MSAAEELTKHLQNLEDDATTAQEELAEAILALDDLRGIADTMSVEPDEFEAVAKHLREARACLKLVLDGNLSRVRKCLPAEEARQ